MGKEFVRLPLMVGNYRSPPSTKAEFRFSAADELATQNIAMM